MRPSRQRPISTVRLRVLVLVAVVLGALMPHAGAAAEDAPGLKARLQPRHAHDRVIVTYKPGASRVRRARSVADVEAASVRKASPLAPDTVVVELEAGQSVADAIVSIGAEPGVAYVGPDYWLTAAATSDDPYYTRGDLWGMYGDATTPGNAHGSGAGEAWARGFTGSRGVYVGIVDEGVQADHADLRPNIWVNPFETVNGRDDDGNGYVDDIRGWDFYHGDASVYDAGEDAHGTHVAGTVGARGGNGRGVAGVNWRVTLIVAKFLGPDGGFTSDAVRALDYITDLKERHGLEIRATNNSYSGPFGDPFLLDAIERAGDQGILFVAAAGNGVGGPGHDIDATPEYPAAFTCDRQANGSARGWDCLIAVANLRPDGQLANSSNYGASSVDLAAPGTNVQSTVPNGYASFSGTSMAAPHVAGAVALCASLDDSLTARQIRDHIMETAMATASLAGATLTGARLDIGALVDACAPPPPTTRTMYVDDLDPTFRRFGPGWRGADTGYAERHFHVPARTSTRVRFAAWKPVLPGPGRYRVEAWIPARHASSRKAAYKVRTTDGWVTRVRNQSKRRGSWVSLGIHELARTPIVQLADVTGEPARFGRRLAFDAVRFVPYGVPATAERD